MSTPNIETGKDQENLSPGSASLYNQDTLERQHIPKAGTFPQPPPPVRPPHMTRNRWLMGITIAVLLVLVLSLGAVALLQPGSKPASKVTPTPSPAVTATTSPATTATTTPAITPTTTPPAGVILGPQPCPPAVADPAYWLPIVKLHSYGGPQTIESVSCASMMLNSSLQVLVTARHPDAAHTLDVYVFTNITQSSPTLLFQLNGLVQGDAKISGYSTVMTAQADQLSTINAGKPTSAMTADLFREFKWSANAGKMVQTVFPGFFPDMTRYQAEADQASVNQGHQPWKLSAMEVATSLAASQLNWPPNALTPTLLSGGGVHDVSAVVQVRNTRTLSGAITVTLSRLEGNTDGGIWEVISVGSDGMSITSPAPLSQFSNPVQVTGTGPAFEGQIGQVILLDHLYTKLGQAKATGASGMGHTTFSTTLFFQSTFPAGIQEGVLLLSVPSQANGSIAGEVMEKVLINGALESPFAVLGVDLTVNPSSITGISCGSLMTLTYTATFHVQAGTAGGTIQFLYTWNNGRASPSGSITVPPNGPSTATFTYTATGQVGGAYAFPGVAQVSVTSPDRVQSPQIVVTGTCSTSTQPSASAAPTLTPLNGTTYVGWTGINGMHNLSLAPYDPATKTFGTMQVLTDTTLSGQGPGLAIFNGNLYVAWLGTDGHLNIARYNPADPTRLADKVTLTESSTDAPSLFSFNGRLYLSWRSTDGHLNIISSADATHFDTKVTYNIAIRTSPTLGAADNALFIAWEDTSVNSYIVFGRYDPSNPANLSVVVTTASSQLPVGLASLGVPAPFVEVAWHAVSDATIHLGTFEGTPNLRNAVTTAQFSPYGPTLTNAGGTRYLCWTGIDEARSVNVNALNI
jgi:hypothetical protein